MSPDLSSLSPGQIIQKLGQTTRETPDMWGAVNQAAVLVPLVIRDQNWHLLFTKRTDFLATHKGQISFPGGRAETGDFSPEATALRETWEEVGIPDNKIEIAGRLAPFVTHYGVTILPVAGILQWPVDLKISTDEVSRVFTAPLSWFADHEHLETRVHYEPDGFERPVIYFREYNGDVVWGITAHIIDGLIHTLGLR